MPSPRTSYTARVSNPKPRKVGLLAGASLQEVIERYSEALEQGDEDSALFWLNISSDMTDTI